MFAASPDVKPVSTSDVILPQIRTMDDETLVNCLCDFIEHGPESLIEPIKAEFARRGIAKPFEL